MASLLTCTYACVSKKWQSCQVNIKRRLSLLRRLRAKRTLTCSTSCSTTTTDDRLTTHRRRHQRRLGRHLRRLGGTSDIQAPWTAIGTAYPTRVPLHPHGCEHILDLSWRVDMAKSARRAVAGDGVCIGLLRSSCIPRRRSAGA